MILDLINFTELTIQFNQVQRDLHFNYSLYLNTFPQSINYFPFKTIVRGVNNLNVLLNF